MIAEILIVTLVALVVVSLVPYRPGAVARRLAREPHAHTLTLELSPASGASHHLVLDVSVGCADQARLVALLKAKRKQEGDPIDAAIAAAYRPAFAAWAADREPEALALISASVPAEVAAAAGRAFADQGLVVHRAQVRCCVALTPELANLRRYDVHRTYLGAPSGFVRTCNALELHLDATLGRNEWFVETSPVGGGYLEILPARTVVHDDARTVRAVLGGDGGFVVDRTFRQMREGVDVR